MNRKFVSKSNLVLSKILNSNNCLDILKDFIETILKVKIKNITLNKTNTIQVLHITVWE